MQLTLKCTVHCTDWIMQHTYLHCTALHCTALHCTALHTALHCTALQVHTVPYRKLYCTLYCTVLYCTVLYCTAHSTQLTVLYCILFVLLILCYCARCDSVTISEQPEELRSPCLCIEESYSHLKTCHGQVCDKTVKDSYV